MSQKLTPETYVYLLNELRRAVNSGVGSDWAYDGNDEYEITTFDGVESLENVLNVLKENGLIELPDMEEVRKYREALAEEKEQIRKYRRDRIQLIDEDETN